MAWWLWGNAERNSKETCRYVSRRASSAASAVRYATHAREKRKKNMKSELGKGEKQNRATDTDTQRETHKETERRFFPE